MLAGLRHGRTLGTPLALVVRNLDHKNWTWGMSPWPPEGEPQGKGTKPVTLPRPGHADLAGVLKYGLDDVRNALERASARHTAVARRRRRRREGAARRRSGSRSRARRVGRGRRCASAIDAARAERDTVGGVVEVRARACRRGSARTRRRRTGSTRGSRRRVMGIQAVKGVEIGDGFALAGRRGSEAHDEIARPTGAGETNHAGGIEAGISNGEEIVVRAAMKPLPTLMKPLGSVDLATGEPAQALVERSDVAAVEALAVVAEAAVAWELARAAREKFGGDAIGDFVAAWRAYLERIEWPNRRTRWGATSRSIGFMGAARRRSAARSRAARAAVPRPRPGDRAAARQDDPGALRASEARPGSARSRRTRRGPRSRRPSRP